MSASRSAAFGVDMRNVYASMDVLW